MEKEKVDKLLSLLISGIERGTDFANQNAGPLFEEYYRYELSVVFCWIGLSTLLLVLGGLFMRLAHKKNDEILVATGFVISLIFGFVLLVNIFDAGLAMSNPKIWTIQQIASDLRH